jgi:hypothetical protein
MKKFLKIAALALAAVLALGIFAACDKEQDGGSDNDSEGETKVNVYAIKAGDVTVELGKKADATVKKLGTPVNQQNTGNCGGLGETIRYEYGSFVLVVVDYEDGDMIIDQIELKNDGAETSKGIYIGSSEADVKSKYGEPDEKQGSAYVYEDNGKRLEIGITDGSVSSIVFLCVD